MMVFGYRDMHLNRWDACERSFHSEQFFTTQKVDDGTMKYLDNDV